MMMMMMMRNTQIAKTKCLIINKQPVFTERHYVTFGICYRPSVCRLSVCRL